MRSIVSPRAARRVGAVLLVAAIGVAVGLLLSGCGGQTDRGADTSVASGPESKPPPTAPEKKRVGKDDARSGSASDAPRTFRVADSPTAFPTFGVAVTAPDGWRLDTAQPFSGFVGRWLKQGDDAGDWSQFAVELRSASDARSARQAAAGLERRGYTRTEAMLGGVPAERLDAPAGRETAPRPTPLFIAHHDGRLWQISFLFGGRVDADAVRGVLDRWRWLPREPAAAHLELGDRQSVFNSAGSLRVPAIARVDAPMTRGDTVAFIAYDHSEGQDAVSVVCRRVDAAPTTPIQREARRYADQLQRGVKLERPPTFTEFSGRSDLVVSDWFRQDFGVGAGAVTRVSRYAVWRPRADVLVRMQALVNNEVCGSGEGLDPVLETIERVFLSCSRLSDSPASDAARGGG